MQHSRTRLTIYAILSSIEMDARSTLRASLSPGELHTLIAPEREEMRAKAQSDFGRDTDLAAHELLDYADWAQQAQIIARAAKGQPKTSSLSRLAFSIDGLTQTRNRVMHGRPLKGEDYTKALATLADLSTLRDLPLTRVTALSEQLERDPNSILQLQIPVPQPESILHNLPTPDFDDTGLIGREDQTDRIKERLLSNQRVISVVGEGGVGKSALTVAVLYDLLDDLIAAQSPRFEAIVWTSLKTKTLSASGIRELSAGIVSTMSLYESVQRELGLPKSVDISQIVAFMAAFPMLLVIDNLETINVGSVRELLTSVAGMNTDSKILITSRLGVGEIEERYALSPLSQAAAVQLLRATARSQQANELLKAPNITLGRYVRKLYCNPLAIKWFVGRSASGAPVNDSLTKKDNLLEFCFENIYETLSGNEVRLIELFLFARRPLTFAELDFFGKPFDIDYVAAINRLLGTSVVRYTIDHVTRETTYELTDFAFDYVRRFHQPENTRFLRFNRLLEDLNVLSQEALGVRASRDRYDPTSLSPTPSNRSELIAAAYLKRALVASRSKDRESAVKLLDSARGIAPDYPDVFKISGFIYGQVGELFLADDFFRSAVDAARERGLDDAVALTAYAAFLLYRLNSRFDEALQLATEAVALDPRPETELVKGRALMYLGENESALQCFDAVLSDKRATKKQRIIAFDQAADDCRRAAEPYTREADTKAFEWAFKGYGYLSKAISEQCFDTRLSRRVYELCNEVTRANDNVFWAPALAMFYTKIISDPLPLRFGDSEQHSRLIERATLIIGSVDGDMARDVQSAYRTDVGSVDGGADGRVIGFVTRIIRRQTGGFGFIFTSQGEELFFPLSAINYTEARSDDYLGAMVSCKVVADLQGRGRRRASDIYFL